MFISPPEKTYGQTLTMRLLLMFPLSMVLLIVFVAADFETSKIGPVSWAMIAVTLGLSVFGWWAISKRLLAFHPEGVAYSTAFGAKELRWEEIGETYYWKIDQNLYVHLGLIGLLMAASASRRGDTMSGGQMNLKLTGLDPKQKISITAQVKDCAEAIRAVLGKVNPRIKPELQRRMQGGETVMFGVVSLSRQGIGFKQKPQVALSEVGVKFNGTYLTVKKEGKWRSEFRAPAQKIPNVFVLLDLIEEIKLGGAARPPDPFAHMAK